MEKQKRAYPFGPYGLSMILVTLFAVSWIAQTYAGWVEFQAEAQTHGEVAAVFGNQGYVWKWLSQTMENWQSEFLQLLTFVILTAHFVHLGSHESRGRDNDKKNQNRME